MKGSRKSSLPLVLGFGRMTTSCRCYFRQSLLWTTKKPDYQPCKRSSSAGERSNFFFQYLLWQRARGWWNVVLQIQLHRLDGGEIHSRAATYTITDHWNWKILDSTWITPWSLSWTLPHQTRREQGCHCWGVEGPVAQLNDMSTWIGVDLVPEDRAA